jgi:hypothetical protein
VILTTLLFVSAENTDSWRGRMFRWFISPKPGVITDDINLFSVEFTWGETIHFGNLEFNTNRF